MSWPRVGQIFIPPECGWWRVVAVEGDVVTLRQVDGGETRREPIADFAWDSKRWRHHTEMPPRPRDRGRESDSLAYATALRDAGRGHLVKP